MKKLYPYMAAIALILGVGKCYLIERDARVAAVAVSAEVTRSLEVERLRSAAITSERDTLYIRTSSTVERVLPLYEPAKAAIAANPDSAVRWFVEVADTATSALKAQCEACRLLNESLRNDLRIADDANKALRSVKFAPPPRIGLYAGVGACGTYRDKFRVEPCVQVGVGIRIF